MRRTIALSINTAWNVVNFRTSLIHALIKHGYDVVVIAPRDEYAEQIPMPSCRYIPIAMDNGGTNPLRDLKLLFDFYRIFSKIRPFCFLGYTVKPNVYGSFAARALQIPTINNVAGLGTAFIKDSWITVIAKLLYRTAFASANKVFFQNNDDLEYFVRFGLVKGAIATRIPGSGIDISRFIPKGNRRQDEPFRFLLVGRLLWDKGIQEYVDAARLMLHKYPDIEFQMLGFLDVANRTAVPRSTVELWESDGLIVYLGRTDDVAPFIEQAGCVVLPSYREGAPRALLEAASMAKPVITTDVAGCRDVVDNGVSGFLVKAGDATDLAAKMEMLLLMSEEQRTAMGQKGRDKMVREFDESIVIAQYLEAIDSLAHDESGIKVGK